MATSGTRTAGDRFIAPRNVRQELTSALSVAMRASAAGSMRASFARGYGWTEIDSPDFPASGATLCHSSSVTNGTNGCARRSVASSSRTSMLRVPRAAASSPRASASASCTLASSTYQSQYSSHTNSYSARAARSNRYCSMWDAMSCLARCRQPSSQRSAKVCVCGSVGSRPQSFPSTFISTKRDAFHSLLQKLR